MKNKRHNLPRVILGNKWNFLRGAGGNMGIYGALALYLDFINIFLSLLRIFGRQRD